MKLFAFYLGGRAPGCKIELHDVAFCIGNRVQDCYESLKSQWFGEIQGLHIDAYTELTDVNGYHVSVQEKKEHAEKPDKKLYFVNLGGYDSQQLMELHKSGFYVTSSVQEAKECAKKESKQNLFILHTDNVLDVEDCLNHSSNLFQYELKLTVSEKKPEMQFICGYNPVSLS